MNFVVDLDSYAEGAILLDGFEDCIIGIVEEFGNGRRLLYSKDMILDKFRHKKAVRYLCDCFLLILYLVLF